MDVDLAVSLLSALEGPQIYPAPTVQPKSQVFTQAAESVSSSGLPDGTYYLERKVKSINKTIKATMNYSNGKYVVLAGSDFCPTEADSIPDTIKNRRKKSKKHAGKLSTNETFDSASYAAIFILGHFENGLRRLKDASGKSLKEIVESQN